MKLKNISYEEVDFAIHASQQVATVIFDREEDEPQAQITVIKDGKVNQFTGNNVYNPSERRRSSCVYVVEEFADAKAIKICTIQHKGTTLIEIHDVGHEEMKYLFSTTKLLKHPWDETE